MIHLTSAAALLLLLLPVSAGIPRFVQNPTGINGYPVPAGWTVSAIKDEYFQGSVLNLQDRAVKQEIIQSGSALIPADLVGSWVQSVGMSSGETFMDGSGNVFQGRHGYGHILEFDRNGLYRLTYLYNSTESGTVNRAEVVESGRYNLKSGNQLFLERDRYDASYVVMGTPSQETKQSPPTKSFLVGMTPDQRVLVIFGFPFEYSVSVETNQQGEPYILEGFQRN